MAIIKNKIFKLAISVILSLIVATLLIVIFFQKASVNAVAESNAIGDKHQVENPGSDVWQYDEKGYVGFKEHMDQVVEDNKYVENTFDVTVDLKSKCEVSYKSLSITLVLDLSNTMYKPLIEGEETTRLDAAVAATKGLARKYFEMSANVPGDKPRYLTIIGFNTHGWLLVVHVTNEVVNPTPTITPKNGDVSWLLFVLIGLFVVFGVSAFMVHKNRKKWN